jgi:20S proteasome subunit beta 3
MPIVIPMTITCLVLSLLICNILKCIALFSYNPIQSYHSSPYFIEPLIAGLEDNRETGEKDVPFISGMDLIGAPVSTKDFLVGGTASEQLYGVCEAMYKQNMQPEQLFETISQCLLAAIDRDCLAGWGAVVYIITPEGVTSRQLKSRVD